MWINLETIERERAEVKEAKNKALTDEKAALEAELPTFKGLFGGARRSKIEARLAEIEVELKKLS